MSVGIFSNPTSSNLIHELQNTEVWQSERWVSRQARFLELACTGKFERESLLLDKIVAETESATIIDYGGGSGWLYHKLKSMNFLLKDYINVECMNLHANCKHDRSDYTYLQLGLQLSTLKRSTGTNILYLNSVVQYLEADSILAKAALECSPTHLILEDVTLSQGDEFFALQLYYESRIPYRFVSETALVTKMANAGYSLNRKIPYERNIADGYSYAFEGDASNFHIGETVSLEFTRL